MADNKNMALNDDMMAKATGGESDRGSRYSVGEQRNVMANSVMYVIILASWYDDQKGEYIYACRCVMHGHNADETRMFAESDIH